ncbi:MAG TPA: hypothetical protein VKG61_04870 [Streptosporangiaceae bacterium]|nr:hypothetical protein [Streptosporangiaceae bacterium]
MPTEVIATLGADQQIAGLDRTHARVFGEFLDDLAARGCQVLGYRLSGPAPADHICVKRLRDSLRVAVAFEGQQRAWILLVGRHDDQDPVLNVYAELYQLLGVEPPDSARRDKPPCCDKSTDLPPILGAALTEFVDRAAKVRRTRRQPTSLPASGRGRQAGHGQVEQSVDREPAVFVTCRRPAPQGREIIRHTGAVVLRSVTGPASLTYRIGLTCIGELVVKVATLGRTELDDLYSTTRTPGRPTSESAAYRASG